MLLSTGLTKCIIDFFKKLHHSNHSCINWSVIYDSNYSLPSNSPSLHLDVTFEEICFNISEGSVHLYMLSLSTAAYTKN